MKEIYFRTSEDKNILIIKETKAFSNLNLKLLLPSKSIYILNVYNYDSVI